MNRKTHADRDAGYVLALGALLMVPLMVATGFAVDLGSWVTQASKEQRAADSAALAGVVWLPDLAKATDVALEAAAKNGYCDAAAVPAHCAVANATVVVDEVPGRRLSVSVSSPADLFFAGLILEDFEITRKAVSEFVVAVPLGSPRNYIGTGQLTTNSTAWRENVWTSIHGYCTHKTQGDQKATKAMNTNCSGAVQPDYSDKNYEYYVELPETRAYDTDVIIYRGGYNSSDPDLNEQDYGQSQPPPDFRYRLYQADDTPLDDGDNPLMSTSSACSSTGSGRQGTHTFNNGASDDNYTFTVPEFTYTDAGQSDGWWLLCRIPAAARGGKYILRVDNEAENKNGANQFSLVASPVTAGQGNQVNPSGQRVCDSRNDATCPRVFAKDYLSYFLNAPGSSAEFFLAEIEQSHAGKRAVITLWDPAEGADQIEILRPTGAGIWTEQSFDHTSTNGFSGTGVTVLPTPGQRYNGELVTIQFDLADDYDPADYGDNAWWRVRYSGGGGPTDRTTWGLTLIGDPVRLVE